jgi:ribulose-5-phosphate 4-epimerase/fuculose-1-phosphate aldolase
MECGLLPLAQTSMRFVHIAYHDFEGIADDVGERERLVKDLGNLEAMVLRNHGLLVASDSVPGAFNALYRLERACEVQVMAMAANTKLKLPPQDILEATYDKMKPRPKANNRNGSLAWPALLRKLDRIDTSYRN